MTNRQQLHFVVCPLCNEPVEIETAKTDGNGKAIHEECYVMSLLSKGDATPPSPNHEA